MFLYRIPQHSHRISYKLPRHNLHPDAQLLSITPLPSEHRNKLTRRHIPNTSLTEPQHDTTNRIRQEQIARGRKRMLENGGQETKKSRKESHRDRQHEKSPASDRAESLAEAQARTRRPINGDHSAKTTQDSTVIVRRQPDPGAPDREQRRQIHGGSQQTQPDPARRAKI